MSNNDLIRRRDLLPEAVYYIIADPKEALDELLKRCKTAPAVDAVEVVKCINCKHFIPGHNLCNDGPGFSPIAYNPETWFCPHGEQKEENT